MQIVGISCNWLRLVHVEMDGEGRSTRHKHLTCDTSQYINVAINNLAINNLVIDNLAINNLVIDK